MASTAGAYEAVAAIRQRQLLAFLSALDAFHVAESAIDAGLDPTTGAALAPGGAQAALSSAVADLATALHAAIDTGWSDAFAAASRQVWGGRDPGEAARRALASEVASQKAFATRFAADVAAGVPQQPGRWPEGRRATAYADAATAGYQISAAIGSPDGTLIWWRLGEVSRHCYLCPIHAANSPFTRESLPSTPRDGATPCKSACKCSLSFTEPTTPPLRTGPEVDEETQRNRQFEDRVFLPPPAPPGLRLPNADERGVLRDLEIQRNEARRRLHEAEVAGRKDEVKAWAGRSRDLTRQIREYAQDRGVHHVPTFRVEDVISGKDIGRRDIDRLTHFRGIDGVSISRAQAQAIRDAATAAKRDVLRVLEGYPAVDAVSREEWRDALRRAGAPASAFGGPLVRVGEATDAHCGDEACDACHAPSGAVSVCARPVLSAVRAVEARVPDVQAETIDDPADWRIVNVIAATARETLENHVVALEVLAKAGRRTGIAPYRVEVGPFTEGWDDLVAVGGTWVQGPASEVSRFLEAWAASAPAPIVTAPWQPIG